MQQISLALMGFGNVGQAFVRLISKKEMELKEKYGINFIVSGLSTGRHGSAINSAGVNLTRALELIKRGENLQTLSERQDSPSGETFIHACSADFLVESTPLNQYDGLPALNYIKTALHRGMHVVSANKGPVVFGFQELTQLAEDHGKKYYFESAVMDGAPIFSVFREALPLMEINGFEGILNSCTNYLLGLMETGLSFEDAVTQAQSIGITETDPSADIDGWDASIKLAAISTVLLGIPLTPQEVNREGIRSITPEKIQEAANEGKRWKLVCKAARSGNQLTEASVKPVMVSSNSSLYNIDGTSSYVQFSSDVLPGLGITETDPGPETTAYGLLADILNILKRYPNE
jgi:homoserine dehydrogenase